LIFDNSPALGWIRLVDGIASYNNKIYIIPNDSTEKKYVYWDVNSPDRYIFSNTQLEPTLTKFLIAINDNGQHTIVSSASENFNIKFDNNLSAKLEVKINATYDVIKENNEKITKKFSSIEQTNEVLTNTVGRIEESTNGIIEKVSKVEQKSDSLLVQFKDRNISYQTNKIREEIYGNFILINTALGGIDSRLREAIVDNKWDKEDTAIKKQKVADEVNNLNKTIDDFKKYLEDNIINNKEISEKYPNLVSYANQTIERQQKDKQEIKKIIDDFLWLPNLDQSMKNLFYTKLETMLTQLSRQQNSLLEYVAIPSGGSVTEILSKFFLSSNGGMLRFEEKINGLQTKYSELNASLSGFSTTVRENRDKIQSVESNITQLSDSISTKVSQQDMETRVTQLSNQISSKVSSSEFTSLIQQNPNSVVYSFARSVNSNASTSQSNSTLINEAISASGGTSTAGGNTFYYYNSYGGVESAYQPYVTNNNIVIDSNGITINKGRLACDAISVPPGHFPYIRLFDDATKTYLNGGEPAIEATFENNIGFGDSIRLKWNDGSYLRVGKYHKEDGER